MQRRRLPGRCSRCPLQPRLCSVCKAHASGRLLYLAVNPAAVPRGLVASGLLSVALQKKGSFDLASGREPCPAESDGLFCSSCALMVLFWGVEMLGVGAGCCLLAGQAENSVMSRGVSVPTCMVDSTQIRSCCQKDIGAEAFVQRSLCPLDFVIGRSAKSRLLGLPASYGNNSLIKPFFFFFPV